MGGWLHRRLSTWDRLAPAPTGPPDPPAAHPREPLAPGRAGAPARGETATSFLRAERADPPALRRAPEPPARPTGMDRHRRRTRHDRPVAVQGPHQTRRRSTSSGTAGLDGADPSGRLDCSRTGTAVPGRLATGRPAPSSALMELSRPAAPPASGSATAWPPTAGRPEVTGGWARTQRLGAVNVQARVPLAVRDWLVCCLASLSLTALLSTPVAAPEGPITGRSDDLLRVSSRSALPLCS